MFDAKCQPVALSALMQRGRGFTPMVRHLGSSGVAEAAGDDAYARGLADGQQFADAAFDVDRIALQKLAANAVKLEAENNDELSAIIRETVFRLVEQIIGNVDIDRVFLEHQIAQATALIGDADAARTLWLNPQDHGLLADAELSLQTRIDPALQRGNLRIDCSGGWIEHGSAFGIDKLRETLRIKDSRA